MATESQALLGSNHALDDVVGRLLHPTGEPKLDVKGAVRAGWAMFEQHPWAYMFWALIYIILQNVAVLAYFAESAKVLLAAPVLLLLSVPFQYAPFIVAANTSRDNDWEFDVGSFLFTPVMYFFPIIVITLLVRLLTVVGLALLVLPGIYAMATLSFAPMVFIEYHNHGINVLDSMAVSYRTSRHVVWSIVVLAALSLLILLAGSLWFGVGGLVALPVVQLAWADAFRQLFGYNPIFSGDPASCLCCGCV
ncbi:Glycerophosphocholine acyltransferase 1 [Plasmodiophora brassicae]